MFLLSLHGQAQAKKLRAEKLLAKIEASMVPVNPSNDQETITDEERSVFRRIGLRMKAYLPLGQFLLHLWNYCFQLLALSFFVPIYRNSWCF